MPKITLYNAAMATAAPPMSSAGREVILEDPNQCYRFGSLIVAPKPTEQMLALAYLRWEAENLLPMIFYEGVPKLSWFLETYQQIECLGCYRRDGEKTDLVGFGWFNKVTLIGQHKKAEVGMAFFRHTSRDTLLRFGQLMLKWSFDKLALDVAFGSTPVKNRAAVLYMQRLGFDFVGPVEGYTVWDGDPCAVYISWMTKEKFNAATRFRVAPASSYPDDTAL